MIETGFPFSLERKYRILPFSVIIQLWDQMCVCVSGSVMSDSSQFYRLCPPGSSVHEILQARILEQVANSFSRGSSQPRD